MTATALERLERGAVRAGWRLRWKSAADLVHPNLTQTELDIFDGKRLVTRDGPVIVWHVARDQPDNGLAGARETIAEMVLRALPRPPAGARTGGRP